VRQPADLVSAFTGKWANLSRAVGRAHRRHGAGAALTVAARWIVEGKLQLVADLRQRRFDRSLDVETVGRQPVTATMRSAATHADSVEYAPVPASHFKRMLRRLPIDSPGDFAFVDLGSGKGLALLLAAHYGFRPVLGVELDPELLELSRANVRSFESGSPTHEGVIQVTQGDAANFTLPPRPTVLFLFNPFGEATIRVVVDNIERSLKESRRPIFVAYYNPVHQEVLDERPLLRPVSMTTRWAVYEAGEPR
jgi:SAM-dependent methyltransferase